MTGKRPRPSTDADVHEVNGHALGYFIAVHAGAGYHSPPSQPQVAKAMKAACRAARATLAKGAKPDEAVAAAISVLEDDPCCNAGRGSNLTLGGEVECDASLMTGCGAFGAVGAARGLRNPVRVAWRLAKESREPMPCGLVRPIMLVGEGARRWASGRGLETAETDEDMQQMHVTPRARRQWRTYRAMLDGGGEAAGWRHPCPPMSARLDTVGAVVVDAGGRVAAGVSSGGIALKQEGRVGEAALFGAGCWAEEGEARGLGVGASTTGVGERVVVHLLSRAAARATLGRGRGDASVSASLRRTLAATVLQGPPPRDAGVICALVRQTGPGGADPGVSVEFGAAHCSRTMAVATCSAACASPAVSFMPAPAAPSGEGAVAELALSCRWGAQAPAQTS